MQVTRVHCVIYHTPDTNKYILGQSSVVSSISGIMTPLPLVHDPIRVNCCSLDCSARRRTPHRQFNGFPLRLL